MVHLSEEPELGVMSKPMMADIWLQWRNRIPGVGDFCYCTKLHSTLYTRQRHYMSKSTGTDWILFIWIYIILKTYIFFVF